MDEKDKQILVERMKKIAAKSKENEEQAHIEADNVLCSLLVTLGYKDLIDVYQSVGKWYS